jgi:phospholipid transport system substrate-binding protein
MMSVSKSALLPRLAASLALAVSIPLGALPAPALAQAVRGHGDASAESYVQEQVQKAISILNDRSLGAEGKKRAFYAFVNQVADVPRITNFVLGRYRRQLTPAQYQQFSEIFREYADSVYETRLGDYHGETLKVVGSQVRTPGDVVVSSVIQGGSYSGNPVVNWRVIQGPQGWKVVDVQAQGVWLAVVEQQDFTSTLANSNGNVETLMQQLRTQAANGTAGKPRQ